jgi:tetratricopeptide (TPR) repeat protein
MLDLLQQSTVEGLADAGDHEEAFALAAEIAPRLEASGDVWDLAAIRAAQVRLFALQGEAAPLVDGLEWLEPAARGTGDPQVVAAGLGAAAVARAGLGQDESAAHLLAELESYPGVRESQSYQVILPAIVRAALRIGEPALAERLVAGLEPLYPYAEYALVAANAALTEARGDLQAAADAYADAADRWERFGVVPEEAFALLGQGRCLVALSRPTEAAAVLQQAREIFERLKAAPALVETDALLAQTIALSS